MKIVMGKDRYQLVAEVTASIEAGRHDGRSHFDHHGVFEGETCPCENTDIVPVDAGTVVGITHLDADTLVGLIRMIRPALKTRLLGVGVDFALMAKYDVKAPGLPRGMSPPHIRAYRRVYPATSRILN